MPLPAKAFCCALVKLSKWSRKGPVTEAGCERRPTASGRCEFMLDGSQDL